LGEGLGSRDPPLPAHAHPIAAVRPFECPGRLEKKAPWALGEADKVKSKVLKWAKTMLQKGSINSNELEEWVCFFSNKLHLKAASQLPADKVPAWQDLKPAAKAAGASTSADTNHDGLGDFDSSPGFHGAAATMGAAPAPDSPPRPAHGMVVKKLKGALRAAGLDHTGLRPALVRRLAEHRGEELPEGWDRDLGKEVDGGADSGGGGGTAGGKGKGGGATKGQGKGKGGRAGGKGKGKGKSGSGKGSRIDGGEEDSLSSSSRSSSGSGCPSQLHDEPSSSEIGSKAGSSPPLSPEGLSSPPSSPPQPTQPPAKKQKQVPGSSIIGDCLSAYTAAVEVGTWHLLVNPLPMVACRQLTPVACWACRCAATSGASWSSLRISRSKAARSKNSTCSTCSSKCARRRAKSRRMVLSKGTQGTSQTRMGGFFCIGR
jgi:hypothetical protein